MLDDQKMFKKEITYDGLHPNEAGYAIMEPLAEKAISTALHAIEWFFLLREPRDFA